MNAIVNAMMKIIEKIRSLIKKDEPKDVVREGIDSDIIGVSSSQYSLSLEERMIAKKLGISEKDWIKHREMDRRESEWRAYRQWRENKEREFDEAPWPYHNQDDWRNKNKGQESEWPFQKECQEYIEESWEEAWKIHRTEHTAYQNYGQNQSFSSSDGKLNSQYWSSQYGQYRNPKEQQHERRQEWKGSFARGGHTKYSPRSSSQSSIDIKLQEAYNKLGISSSASIPDIKKAYRKLINKHHPDKLAARGLPEGKAKEKTQAILSAYDLIREDRGFK